MDGQDQGEAIKAEIVSEDATVAVAGGGSSTVLRARLLSGRQCGAEDHRRDRAALARARRAPDQRQAAAERPLPGLPLGSVQVQVGAFEGGAAWQRFAIVHFFMTFEAITLMSLAFMFSCFNIKPAAATILAISVFFISMILHDMPYFHEMREWFMVHHLYVWTHFFRSHIPWWRVGESLSILAGYNITFLIIGCAAFQARDIKS